MLPCKGGFFSDHHVLHTNGMGSFSDVVGVGVVSSVRKRIRGVSYPPFPSIVYKCTTLVFIPRGPKSGITDMEHTLVRNVAQSAPIGENRMPAVRANGEHRFTSV